MLTRNVVRDVRDRYDIWLFHETHVVQIMHIIHHNTIYHNVNNVTQKMSENIMKHVS